MELACSQGKVRRTQHKAAFTALLPEIKDTLHAGYSLRLAWECLTNDSQIDMSYDTFRRLCIEAGLRGRKRCCTTRCDGA